MLILNYKIAYDCLMNLCKCRGLDKKLHKFKTHKHHIIPKCLGGLDIEENYVLLTLQEHKNAHKLLTLIYPENNKLRNSFNLMSGHHNCEGMVRSSETRAKISSAKKGVQHTEEAKQKMRDKTITVEHKLKISNSNKGRKPTEAEREKMRVARRKRIISDETKAKLSAVQLGKKRGPYLKSTSTIV